MYFTSKKNRTILAQGEPTEKFVMDSTVYTLSVWPGFFLHGCDQSEVLMMWKGGCFNSSLQLVWIVGSRVSSEYSLVSLWGLDKESFLASQAQ